MGVRRDVGRWRIEEWGDPIRSNSGVLFYVGGLDSRFVAHFVFEIVNGSSGIQSTTTKQKPTHVNNGSRRKHSPGFKCDTEEDQPNETHGSPPRGSHKPFKVEARIDIPSYDGTVDAEKLDSWLDQLETYFTLYGFTSTAKVSFARLKLTSHALAWWNAQLKMTRDRITWNEFKRLLRQEYYPMGYSQDRWSRWHNLRQQRGQSVQEYTTEFRRLAVMLGISTAYENVFTNRIAMAIEVKSKNGGTKIEENVKEEALEKKLTVTSNNSKLFCGKCQISGHVEEKCWKAHPELFPKKWVKNDRGRPTVATTISNEAIELGQVEEVDKSLTLMVKPTSGVTKEKEELFTLKIQVKQELTEAIVDTESEKNLISSSLVERLGLETTPHPRPYSLGWIKKDVDTQVNRQCKFRFAITNQFIDEVTCEVVPLDICQVIFGSPYLWERDEVYFRRAQKYELEKDGKKYIVNKSNITKDDDIVKAFQARRW
ncbi:hypothetical protein Tco_1212593 [Tanacetum coccineum]